MTQKTEKQLGLEITRDALGMGDMCTVGNARQKNLAKAMQDKITKGQIQIYIDIAAQKDKK